jgi:pullulanase/glycogen debranching enzyme
VWLLLFKTAQDSDPFQEVPLNRTLNYWHAFVSSLPEGTLYAFRADGGAGFDRRKVLIDPMQKAITMDYGLRPMRSFLETTLPLRFEAV